MTPATDYERATAALGEALRRHEQPDMYPNDLAACAAAVVDAIASPPTDEQPPWITEAKVVREETDEPHYPDAGTHEWGAFAMLAIEAGGYADLEAIDPWTGRRFWSPAWGGAGDIVEEPAGVYQALHRLIDAMEAHRFLHDREPDTATTKEEGGA